MDAPYQQSLMANGTLELSIKFELTVSFQTKLIKCGINHSTTSTFYAKLYLSSIYDQRYKCKIACDSTMGLLLLCDLANNWSSTLEGLDMFSNHQSIVPTAPRPGGLNVFV